MFATMTVRVFPPRESCRRRVSLESRYGIWELFPSTSAEMTLPRADKDQFMLVSSLNLSPVAPVLFSLSLPAKSTCTFKTFVKSLHGWAEVSPCCTEDGHQNIKFSPKRFARTQLKHLTYFKGSLCAHRHYQLPLYFCAFQTSRRKHA